MFVSLSFLVGAIACTQAILLSREVCYGDLGCFSTDPPFRSIQRPLVLLPNSPFDIGTGFYLYTRATPSHADRETLVAGDVAMLRASRYMNGKPTKLIIHGFVTNSRDRWIQSLIKELLRNDDMNVITVDWTVGAQPPYTRATGNTRVVGAQTAQLIHFLIQETPNEVSSFHVIGHSLGAHTAGYAGERVPGLGRITGLDPAEPYFEYTDPAVRLDPTDAEFVDVIHSDGGSILSLGLGMMQEAGHVDFFPNNGQEQPGCVTSLWGRITGTVWNAINLNELGVGQAIACNHMFALEVYAETVNSPCPFTAYPCNTWDDFENGKCITCSGSGCSVMGYHADKHPGRGSLYLKTGDATVQPTCRYHYALHLTVSRTIRGLLNAELIGERGRTGIISITNGQTIVRRGSDNEFSALILSEEDLGDITSIRISYDKTGSIFTTLLYSSELWIASLSLQNPRTGAEYQFCGSPLGVSEHRFTTRTRC